MTIFSVNEYPSVLPSLTQHATVLDLLDISNYVLENPKFAIWSGCVDNKHHYGFRGLQHHTWEVVVLVRQQQKFFEALGHTDINEKVLFLAALFHDVGKLRDYDAYNLCGRALCTHVADIDEHSQWKATPHKRSIHHISRSAIEWTKAVDKFPRYRGIEDAVLHCILSHHGLREWGSPVFPKSKEAWILHLCDGLSARMNDCSKIDLVHSV